MKKLHILFFLHTGLVAADSFEIPYIKRPYSFWEEIKAADTNILIEFFPLIIGKNFGKDLAKTCKTQEKDFHLIVHKDHLFFVNYAGWDDETKEINLQNAKLSNCNSPDLGKSTVRWEINNRNFGLSSSDSKKFTMQILGTEVNSQGSFTSAKNTKDASKTTEGEVEKPKVQVNNAKKYFRGVYLGISGGHNTFYVHRTETGDWTGGDSLQRETLSVSQIIPGVKIGLEYTFKELFFAAMEFNAYYLYKKLTSQVRGSFLGSSYFEIDSIEEKWKINILAHMGFVINSRNILYLIGGGTYLPIKLHQSFKFTTMTSSIAKEERKKRDILGEGLSA
ncbi:MAG: hypothetical protein Tsb0015_01820 [Simkaniaceae bacterium]